jgi:hypothetical protein
MFRILEIKRIAASDNNGIFSPFALLQQGGRTAQRSESFVYDSGGVSAKLMPLPCNPKGLELAAAPDACGQREWSP